ncbi:MAG: large conductance mechanosensitive channel protein MscL [Lachnospiraceae bacterium]|nr:large conductance mechanosensitive channel protein MscL [Lachnospiraceae bacterium]
MKKFWSEFKAFISKGSVMDMAVGIIIGGGFTAIVNSLVNDVVMPLLSILTGGYDFTKLSVVLGSGEGAATLNYGLFISAVINFLLIALVIFCLIKALGSMKDKLQKKEEEAPTTKVCPFCKSEINIEATRCPHCTSELDK